MLTRQITLGFSCNIKMLVSQSGVKAKKKWMYHPLFNVSDWWFWQIVWVRFSWHTLPPFVP